MVEKKKILVCDDEPSILKVMDCVLSEAGYQVVAASNGLAALEKFLKERFDLLIIDIHMPFLDGFATIAKIRESNKTIPIILEGSYRTADSVRLAQKLKVAAYLVKPFEVKELFDTVNSILAAKDPA